MTTASREDHPYITISRNIDDKSIPCQGVALTIGSKLNCHYQSLLPLDIRVTENKIQPSSPEDSIKLKLIDLESKKEFPELGPPEVQHHQQEVPSSRREIPKSPKNSKQKDEVTFNNKILTRLRKLTRLT